ncbi:hypothetical protein [Mycobacterium heckeshornense]|uniref:hypothetical protein n=1 Tax=Mycobacterium heckeshornense TaxID=110505 RepID=UPI00128F9092|nr:hypothetical protein [Mycobacterium heckeshornense]
MSAEHSDAVVVCDACVGVAAGDDCAAFKVGCCCGDFVVSLHIDVVVCVGDIAYNCGQVREQFGLATEKRDSPAEVGCRPFVILDVSLVETW